MRMLLPLALIAAPVAAQTPPPSSPATPVPLALGLSTGMTKDEVKALHPKSLVPITEGCSGTLDASYSDKRLSFLRITGITGRKETRCGETIIENLKAKYGEPTIGDGANDCVFSKGACLWGAIGDSLSSPLKRDIEHADTINGNRYYEFKGNGITIDARLDVRLNIVDLVYRPMNAAGVNADAQKNL